MPLLTSPTVVLTDGVTPVTFTYQNQVQIGRSVVTSWKALALSAAIAANFRSKYDNSHASLNRNVAQINWNLPIADASLKTATLNLSGVFHKEHDVASLEIMGKRLKDAMEETGFWTNFFNQI
jgi:hypothetical protein